MIVGDQIVRQLGVKGRRLASFACLVPDPKTSAILRQTVASANLLGARARLSSRHFVVALAGVQHADAVRTDSRWKPGANRFDAAAAAGIPSIFDADAGDPEEVLTIARRATHPVFSEPMLKSLYGAPDAALRRAFAGRNVICGVTLGERVLGGSMASICSSRQRVACMR